MDNAAASELAKYLQMLVQQLDSPVFAARAARRVYDGIGVFDDTEQADKRSNAIHPSALARCLRMAQMEFEGLPRFNAQIPPNMRRAGKIGTILHRMIQKAFRETGEKSGLFTFEPEISIVGSQEAARLCLDGNSDGRLIYGTSCLGLEIKSIGESEFASLSAVREKDLYQAAVYQRCLKLDAMWFMYISRRSYAEQHIIARVPDLYWNAMRKRAMTILEHRLNDTYPPGVSDARTCEMCAYSRLCPHPRTVTVAAKEVLKCLERATNK